MEFKKSLVNARHHIVFILGLATALIIAFSIETRESGRVLGNITFEIPEDIPFKSSRVLSEEEFEWANVAWQYFENNYQENTGLVNSVDGYPSTTMWDTASYLMGSSLLRRSISSQLKSLSCVWKRHSPPWHDCLSLTAYYLTKRTTLKP